MYGQSNILYNCIPYILGMSLMFTKSIIQHKIYIDIRIEIALKVLIFSQA